MSAELPTFAEVVDKASAWDALAEKNAEISRLRDALRDIELSEPIPTPFEAWKWCKDLAASTLASDQRHTGE